MDISPDRSGKWYILACISRGNTIKSETSCLYAHHVVRNEEKIRSDFVRRYNSRTCPGNADGKGHRTRIFNFRPVHRPMYFAQKNGAHVRGHDAYDLRAIAMTDAIYTPLTGNPVQETAVQHDRDSSTTAQLQLHRLTVMRRGNGDPDPEAERATRIFRQPHGTVRSLCTWKCMYEYRDVQRRTYCFHMASRISRAESSVNFASGLI